MADINLDDLLKAKQTDAAPTAPLPVPTTEAVEKAVAQLTPEERRKVDQIKDAINLQDTQTTLTFGAPAQKEIADFSDSILQKVRTKDSGPVGELLGQLVTNVREYNESQSESFLSKIPLFGGLVDKAREKKASYDKLSTQVDKIQAGLDDARLQMMKDVAVFDALYEKNLGYFKDLQLYIQAGEEKLHEIGDTSFDGERITAGRYGRWETAAVPGRETDAESRPQDLKLSRTIAIQTAPQIRLIQNNDKALIDRVQTAIYSTIPLWKNQLVIALGLQSQRRVLDMQRAVSDTTNELLKRNAEMLKANTVETAQENERGIVDIETVKKVNEDLISTIEETVKIQQDGRAKRAAAEQELSKIEGRLKETLLKYSSGRPNPAN